MKNLILPTLLICVVFFSCSKEDERPETAVIGEWELVQAMGSLPGAVQEKEDLKSVEIYLFKPDNTFIKKRESDQGVFQATGKYSLTESDDTGTVRKGLKLVFESGDRIHGDCYGDEAVEYLIITGQGQLRNTWGACDGPTLFYAKK